MKMLESAKLVERERNSILEASQSLKSDLPVTRVILFGSKARGTGEPDSDIDLLVLTSCLVTASLRAAISDRLAGVNLRNDVALASVVVSEQDWCKHSMHAGRMMVL
ncbi:hypothetical protein ES703_47048 [subsurface metagenome]